MVVMNETAISPAVRQRHWKARAPARPVRLRARIAGEALGRGLIRTVKRRRGRAADQWPFLGEERT